MKTEVFNMIHGALKLDDTITAEHRTNILELCKHQAPHSAKESNKYLTPNEIADLLNVSLRTVQRYIKSGELSSVKFMGSRRTSEAALNQFINRHSGVADKSISIMGPNNIGLTKAS